jgi:hypothetical protein
MIIYAMDTIIYATDTIIYGMDGMIAEGGINDYFIYCLFVIPPST